MATRTLGTAATTTLTAMVMGANLAADIATIALGIKNDQVNGRPVYPGAWSNTGLLYIPNRGVLQALPGDYIAFDPTTGWPILLSKAAAAGVSWVHS